MFALDTNTVIHFFKGAGRVGERLLATPPSQVAVPAVVVYELEVGVLKSGNVAGRQEQLHKLLAHCLVLAFGAREARVAARIRTELEAKGTPIGPTDVLIAGTALAHGARLVTRNVKEFRRVEGLVVESWYD